MSTQEKEALFFMVVFAGSPSMLTVNPDVTCSEFITAMAEDEGYNPNSRWEFKDHKGNALDPNQTIYTYRHHPQPFYLSLAAGVGG